MTARLARAVALGAALIVVIAGCSTGETGADDGSGPASEEAAPADDATTDDPAASTTDDEVGASPAALVTGEPGPPGALVDATAEAGLDEALLGVRGHAVAVADIDGDGWDDLFVGTFADRPEESYRERGADGPAPDRLLRGSPTGFVLDADFEGRFGRTAGAAFADLDNDGDPDLIVSRNVRQVERGDAPSEIYRNDDGVLVPATVLDDTRGGRAIGVVDYDGDGLRDIVLVEDRWSGGRTAIFRNDGALAFTDVTVSIGFPADVSGLGIGVGDLDGDGIDDLVIGGSNRWFLGDGEGFVEGATSPLPWVLHGDEDDPAHVELVDVDGDGALDVLIGQHFNSTVDQGRTEPVRLFRNSGAATADGADPTFADVTEEVGLPWLATKSPQILLLDLDGDGRRDLVTTASHVDGGERYPVVAVAADDGAGGTTFTTPPVEVDAHYWIDGVILDANGDGRLDVFLVEWEPALGSRLFLNLPIE